VSENALNCETRNGVQKVIYTKYVENSVFFKQNVHTKLVTLVFLVCNALKIVFLVCNAHQEITYIVAKGVIHELNMAILRCRTLLFWHLFEVDRCLLYYQIVIKYSIIIVTTRCEASQCFSFPNRSLSVYTRYMRMRKGINSKIL